ncbi:acyl carrier protein [Actinophytocola sp.]|uniref:acyl carrier protein n=1 Tax=Actinophytocola sp. TaxID=1872138 RepID=UPI002ED51DD5
MSENFDAIGAITELLVNRFETEPDAITLTATFDDIDLDSLSQIELGTAIKKKFAVEITDDELAEMSTVGDVVNSLSEKMVGKGVAV